MKPILTPEQYAIERAICDKAEAYADAMRAKRGKHCNYITAEECTHPDYAACDNDMRGRVEQYEILTEMPATIVAYIGTPDTSQKWRGEYPVTVWTGQEIGKAWSTSSWRQRNWTKVYQFHARIGRNVYTGRGQGEGMSIVLRYSERLSAKL